MFGTACRFRTSRANVARMSRADEGRTELSAWHGLDPNRAFAWYFHAEWFAIGRYADSLVEFSSGPDGTFAMPTEFIAYFDTRPRCILHLRLAEGRGLVCDRVEVLRRPEDPTISTSQLGNLNLRKLIKAAGHRAGWRVEQRAGDRVDATTPDDQIVLTPAVLLGYEGSPELTAFDRAFASTKHEPRRGVRLEDDFLRRVADEYRQALNRGENPTRAVSDHLHTARSNAGRWVAEARTRGFLGPAIPGTAGEIPKEKKRNGNRR